MKKLTILASLPVLMASPSVLAQDNQADDQREEIVVTAKNDQTLSSLLQSAEIFTLSDIEAAQAKDVPALIDQVAGISFRDSGGRGTATGVFVRGASSSQTVVLIDGVRVGSATLGSAALNSYPVEAIERIEIIKGPFSSIYGADAVGGVIQLFTKKGGEGRGAISAYVGNDSLQEFSLALNSSMERFSYHLAVQSEDTDGIDRTSIVTDGNEDIDGFEETAVSLGAAYQLTDSTEIKLSVLATDNTVEFDNTFGSDEGLQTDNETLSTALNVSTMFDNGVRWSTTLGINEDESATNGAFPSEFTTDRDSLGTEIGFSAGDNGFITAGIDYYEENIDSTTVYPVTERDNTGVYAQFTGEADRFSYALSLRYDDNSAYGSDTNGSIGVGFDLSDTLRLSANYGTAFVAPSFNFLYFPFFGNPDLLPEESENTEISLTGKTGAVDWRVTAYRNDVENLFSFDPNTFLAANVGEAELEGIELSFGTEVSDWDIEFNADFLSATNKDTGVELDDRAEQTLRLIASRDWGNLNLRFDIKNESKRFDNSGTQLGGYTLFDASARYELNDNVSFFANVDNLFDKDFTVNLIGSANRYNTEGRQARIGVRVGF